MKPLLMFALLTTLGYAQSPSSPTAEAPAPTTHGTTGTAALLPDTPRLPKGPATVIGGTISNLDRVRDQITIQVFGSRQTMRILFDERTRIFRDGAPASSRALRKEDHVSVETKLDGTDVFAQSIHIFAHDPLGECSGQVLSYNPDKGELVVRDALSPDPVKLQVSSSTSVRSEIPTTTPPFPADLRRGDLISARFSPDRSGRRIARQVVILATPGINFTFSGNITYLDMHSGLLVLTDPRDRKTYEISFNRARIPTSGQLREGVDVVVTANFDGTHYMASDIALTSIPK